jgi:hypothetical protein
MQVDRIPVTDAHDHEPAVADVPEWRRVIEQRLEVLRSELFGGGSGPRRRVSELGRETQNLAMIAAWFEADGNITHAAERLGTSRKTVRNRVEEWRKSYPHLTPRPIPMPLQRHESSTRSEPRRRRGKQKTQASGHGDEASVP